MDPARPSKQPAPKRSDPAVLPVPEAQAARSPVGCCPIGPAWTRSPISCRRFPF